MSREPGAVGDAGAGLMVTAAPPPVSVVAAGAVSNVSATVRHETARDIASTLSILVLIWSFAMPDVVAWCPVRLAHWDGMQEVRGSNPLSSTTHHRRPEGTETVPHGAFSRGSSSLGHTWGTLASAGLSCCWMTAATRACISAVMCR